jgi:hypothetical protein
MAINETRLELDKQKMKDVGRVLGFFNAYSELQTGTATYHTDYDPAFVCDPKEFGDARLLKEFGDPRLLKRTKEELDPHTIYLGEEDCHSLYTEGWNEGHMQGKQAYETHNLELIGEIARLAGRLAPLYMVHPTAENDARDCKVSGEIRTYFITNWRQTGGDKRRRKGI